MNADPDKLKERVFTVVYTAVVTVVLVGIVAAVGEMAKPAIKANREMMENRAIVEVAGLLPEGSASAEEVNALYKKHFGDQKFEETEDFQVLEAKDDSGKPICYVFKTEGMGYWDRIVGYTAVEPDGKTLRGVIFTEHKETPGLGGEITNPAWLAQFKDKTVEKPLSGNIYIAFKKPGTAKGPSEIDAISGATRTSEAVETFFNEDIQRFKDWHEKDANPQSP